MQNLKNKNLSAFAFYIFLAFKSFLREPPCLRASVLKLFFKACEAVPPAERPRAADQPNLTKQGLNHMLPADIFAVIMMQTVLTHLGRPVMVVIQTVNVYGYLLGVWL